MINVSDIRQTLSLHLGTTETNFYTEDKRNDAIYRTMVSILQKFDVPQYVKESALVFVGGETVLPSDCLRPSFMGDKVYSDTEYVRLDYEMFYKAKDPYTYTIKFDHDSELELVKLGNNRDKTLDFWYVIRPERIISPDTQKVWFNIDWLDAISMGATEFLLKNAKDYSGAMSAGKEFASLCSSAWQNERSKIGGEEAQRLRSLYGKFSMFNGSWMPFNSTTATVMEKPFKWVTVNANTQAFPNYGYNCDSASQVIITLPTTAVEGDYIAAGYVGTGGWKIEQGEFGHITFGNKETTVGVGGSIASTASGDQIVLVCVEGPSEWRVESAVGNLTII